MKNTESTRISAISRLFSSSVINELARKGKSPTFTRLLGEADLLSYNDSFGRVRDVYDTAFSILRKKANRHEYVYKSALTQNILMGTHSLNTASMLTEFRIGQCKADVVILNGTGTVYEIKSERDSLSRLQRQINSYRDVFASVYVIAGKKHVDAIFETIPDDVGVMVLSDKHNISTLRKAVDMPERTNSGVIFESIRISEAKEILNNCGISCPELPNTQIYSALRELFVNLPSDVAHREMVKILKRTRNLSPLAETVNQLPQSLRSAALTTPFRKMDQQRLINAVNKTYEEALEWT